MKKKKEYKIGEKFVLETPVKTFVGRLFWSEKKKFRFVLEACNPFDYYHKIYFNNTRKLKKLEIRTYEHTSR